MTASAAGSGGALCPSPAAGGAVITCATAAGSGVVVPVDFCGWCSHFWCCDCDACWSWWSACSRCCAWRAWSYAASGGFPLVGVGVARPVVGSTGETWLRWRFPSPVASSRRPGSSTGLPRFSRFWTRFSSAHFWSLLLCWVCALDHAEVSY